MMADFMDQHMGHDMSEGLVVLGPVVQNRPPVEPDHIGHRRNVIVAAERQPDTLKQPEQIEFAFGVHGGENVLRWKILDVKNQLFAQVAEMFGQLRKGVSSDNLDIGERRRFR